MFRFSISSDQDIIQIIQSSFQNLIGIITDAMKSAGAEKKEGHRQYKML